MIGIRTMLEDLGFEGYRLEESVECISRLVKDLQEWEGLTEEQAMKRVGIVPNYGCVKTAIKYGFIDKNTKELI